MAHPIYRHADGSRLPSVTTVLSKYKDPGGLMHWAWREGVEGRDYRETRDAAANAGTLAHDMIEAEIKGEEYKPPPDADPEELARAEKAFDGFKKWAASTKLEVVETEVSLVCDELRFGGTVDALGFCSGRLALLDWKTSNRIYSDYLVQVAGYRYLWEHGRMNDPEAPVPELLGEEIAELHLLRIGKEWGDFHHHSWPTEVLDLAWRKFHRLREVYEIDKPLGRAV